MSSRKSLKEFSKKFGKSTPQQKSTAASRGASKAVAQWKGRSAGPRLGIIGKDTGFVDLAAANYGCETTGSLTLVATVPTGASTSQRVGKKIEWKSCQLRGTWTAGTTTTIADATVLLVYDSQPQTSLPLVTAVLNTISSASFNNDSNSSRFRILRRWDETFVGNTLTPTTGKEAFDFDEFVKIKKPAVFQNAGTGAIGDISIGALYLITCGSQAAGTTAPNLFVGIRTRFIDV